MKKNIYILLIMVAALAIMVSMTHAAQTHLNDLMRGSYTTNDEGNTVQRVVMDGEQVISGSMSVSEDLTVGSDVLYVDSGADRVGINTTTPNATFAVSGIESFTGGGIQAVEYNLSSITTDLNTVGVADFNYNAMGAGTIGGGTGHQIASLDYLVIGSAALTQSGFASESRLQIEANAAQRTYGDIDLVHVKSDNATNIDATGLWIRGEAYAADDATPKAEGTFTPLIIEPVIGFGTTNAAQMNCSLTVSDDFIVDDIDLFVDVSGDDVGFGTATPTSNAGFLKIVDNTGTFPTYTLHEGTVEANFALASSALIDVSGSPTATLNNLIFRTEETNSQYTPSERMRIGYDGNIGIGTAIPGAKLGIAGSLSASDVLYVQDGGNVLIGDTTSRPVGLEYSLQVLGTAGPDSGMSVQRFSADAGSPFRVFGKSRGATIGTYTVVQDNDLLGDMRFYGADGTDMAFGSTIFSRVNGTPGANDMPSELVFSTSADGSQIPTERLSINSVGVLSTGAETAPDASAGGLTLNQGAADDSILTFKSSDVTHGYTSLLETDTYCGVKKATATGGGTRMISIADTNDAFGIAYWATAATQTTADTATSTAALGVIRLDSRQHDGADAGSAIAAGGNVMVISNNGSAVTIFKGNGDVDADGTFSSGAYDFAEYFESLSGAAIPSGTTVKLVGDKIAPAEVGDTPIGVISETACFVGNQGLEDQDKWARNEYGGEILISEDWVRWKEDEEYIDDKGMTKTRKVLTEYKVSEVPEGVIIPDKAKYITQKFRTPNLDYVEPKDFVSKKDLPQWNVVGLLGQVYITKGQPTAPQWVKMKDVSATVELWLIK